MSELYISKEKERGREIAEWIYKYIYAECAMRRVDGDVGPSSYIPHSEIAAIVLVIQIGKRNYRGFNGLISDKPPTLEF